MNLIDRRLTPFNYFIIGWALLMCLLKAIHGLSLVFVVTFLEYYPEDPTLQDVYYITVRTGSYVTDFLNMLTLIYLFYSQAVAS